MLTEQQKNDFSEILETLGENLDITETQYNAAISSYQNVGNWLSKEDSELKAYNPLIRPQGSFILGTIIQPICEDDDLDIDLVCELSKKKDSWTQFNLKEIVGNQLKSHKGLDDLLDEEGRRCWTLKYRKDSENIKERYHMDILPAIISEGYESILNESYKRMFDESDVSKLCLSITDKESKNYYTSTIPNEWLQSNPLGYAKWFFSRATIQTNKMFSINEAVRPVPSFQKNRFPLQRVVQILKRHRDIMYRDRKDKIDKPISVIITTLASKAYNKETNIIEALINVINNMEYFIKDYNPITEKREKYIENPVNKEENFADKWNEFPMREENFYEWLKKVKDDVENMTSQSGYGLQRINESMQVPFGDELIKKTFNNYGLKIRNLSETNSLKVNVVSGAIGSVGINMKKNNFEGVNE